ncbi:DUF3857 domain-containing transglutaminase family protein [Sphingomonas suaedae]|uniref:DUF3857 domain-containing transglutaminase family protein n=1 Tax=Sphingomonas suaedae TaxID=2599297 RepID=UPI001EF15FB3|nr:DUF3857 domain-containing transglutaminase family protein [Sphingomonas suaedae]
MGHWLGVLAIGAIWAAPALAQTDKVGRGPVPDWARPSDLIPVPAEPEGQIFVRRQDTIIHLDDAGQFQHNAYRIKILHANALRVGNIALSWSPASGTPVVHLIKVYRGDTVIDVLETASFDILRREDQLEAAQLNGILTAVLRVPDLRVGDELEVSLTLPGNDPTLGNANAGLLLLGPQPAAGRYRLGLNWTEKARPAIKMTPDMSAIVQQATGAVDFRFDNPEYLTPPKDSPPRYQWQRIVEYSDFADWAAISRHFAPLYATAAKLAKGSALTQEAARIAAAHSDPAERARAALKLVQQDVRYIYVGLNGGNLKPASAEETWQRRYGDCKGKTAMLLALLTELGIEAEVVLANNSGMDDGLDQRLPNPGMFDHVLIRARIGGVPHYLDGTLPPVAAPSIEPVLPYRWVLPLSSAGTSIERIAWRPAARPDEIVLYEIDAREGFDKPARITTTNISRGLKGLGEHAQLSGVTSRQLLDGLRQQMVGDTWQSIDDVRWHYDEKSQASVMTISGTGTVDWDNDGGGNRSLSLPGGGFNPPDKRVRAAEQDASIPFYTEPGFSCHVTTVRVPRTTKSSQWSFKSDFDTRFFGRNYYRAFELRDGAIRMVRGSRVETPEIDAARARADNARLPKFDNSMAWIYFDPAQEGEIAKRTRVPATFEIDWTADDVPCLHASTKR